jgi:hypothetical protein
MNNAELKFLPDGNVIISWPNGEKFEFTKYVVSVVASKIHLDESWRSEWMGDDTFQQKLKARLYDLLKESGMIRG